MLKFGQRLRAMKSKFPAPDFADKCQQMSADVSGCPPETKRNEVEIEEEEKLPLLGIDKSIKAILSDALWIHNIRPIAKGKNIEECARAAFLFLESKPQRFKNATINDLKSTTLSWIENRKVDAALSIIDLTCVG